MTVQEFVEKYNYRKDDKAKEKFVNDRLKTSYVPFIEKCNMCERIAKASNIDATGKYVQHSAFNYMLYLLSLIDAYTDIDIAFSSEGDVLTDAQYDALQKNGLLERLINLIPKSEATEFGMLIEFANDDLRSNNCDFHVVVDAIMNRIADNMVAISSLIDFDAIKAVTNNGKERLVD